MVMAIAPLLALWLDHLLGEPRRWHPLIIFGRCADRAEQWLYGGSELSFVKRQVRGVVAVELLLLPLVLCTYVLVSIPYIGVIFSIVVLYGCLGLRSLHEHAEAIAKPLLQGDIETARQQLAMIVSRDTETANETQITQAAIESVLENGNDAVFATLFWFFVLGAPGAVLLRAANTLDAMWGYKTEHYLYFGFCAAKLDDVLNWIPARLTAITFACLGNTRRALHCWCTQAPFCHSPNGGPVMTAGAGALQVRLGGGAYYHGQWQEKIVMGEGSNAQASDIVRALKLVRHGAWYWAGLYAIVGMIAYA